MPDRQRIRGGKGGKQHARVVLVRLFKQLAAQDLGLGRLGCVLRKMVERFRFDSAILSLKCIKS